MVYYGLMFIVRSTEKKTIFLLPSRLMDWPRSAADLSTPGCHQPKQIEEPPPGGCDTRVLGFSGDVGKMVKTWMKHD